MTISLERFAYHLDGTFGELVVPGKFRAFTVERPWLRNQPGISCIPVGTYQLHLGMFYHGDGAGGKPDYPAYEILGVPDRSDIKIHIASKPQDVRGCVGPGTMLVYLGGAWAVVGSTDAFHKFMEAMAGVKDDHIVISNAVSLVGGVL